MLILLIKYKKVNKLKKILLYLSALCIILAVPLFNLSKLCITGQKQNTVNTDKGIAVLEKYDSYDVAKTEKKINISNNKKSLRYGGTDAEIKKALSRLEKGKTTYKKLFSNVCIAGDSLMNGLEVYDVLNSNKLVTQVSARLEHLSQNTEKIVSMNPPVLILHYGINLIGVSGQEKTNFISAYSECITVLKKELPDTRIIVSGLFPVDRSIASAARFGKIGEYNKALSVMCKKLDVEFLDSTPVLKAHPECYGADGIHLSKTFYEKYWLKFIVKEKGIVG